MMRARLRCTGKTTPEHDPESRDLSFIAPYDKEDPNPVNASWSRWTPSLTLTMNVTNPEAHEKIEVGKTYEIDFRPVD